MSEEWQHHPELKATVALEALKVEETWGQVTSDLMTDSIGLFGLF